MDENQEDVAVDVNTEVEETTYSNENGAEDTTAKDEEIEKLRKANAQILARAKKAEDALKGSKDPHITKDSSFQEELKLIARGVSDEELEQAKVIAKGKGINLTEAIKDPLFISFQNDLKEKERRENAKLGTSKGSHESIPDIGIKPNMTREEHMEKFKEMMG